MSFCNVLLTSERSFTYTQGVEYIHKKATTMTRNQNKKVIERELKKLNERIDLKIIHGERYIAESKMHRMLLDRMRKFQPKGFFSRLSDLVLG